MNKKTLHKTIFVVGLVITFSSLTAAFFGIKNWYFPAVIGVWFIFDYLSLNKNSTFRILLEDKKQFFNLYLVMFFLGSSIEFIGRKILGWWVYPHINSIFGEILLLLFYPFILFSFREMFITLNNFVSNKNTAFLLAIVLGIIIWEIPNLYSVNWIYLSNYTRILTLPINIIVSWIFLILLPVYVYDDIFKIKIRKVK